MEFTEDQQKALDLIAKMQDSYPEGGRVGVISGYAGTGKSTLIRGLVDIHSEDLLVLAPTGKAAVRVREASGAKSRTIHSQLYKAIQDSETGFLDWVVKPIDEIEVPECGFVVIDEASMISLKVFVDVFQWAKNVGINIVLIGDSYQLEPVKDGTFSVFSDALPAVFKIQLTQIHRQAADSPIIRATMAIRSGGRMMDILGNMPVIVPSKIDARIKSLWESDGVTICYTNATRNEVNTMMRSNLGYPSEQLVQGEPLMVTQNNQNLEIYNGEIVLALNKFTPLNISPVAVKDNQTLSSVYTNFLKTEVSSPVLGRTEALISDKEVLGQLDKVGIFFIKKAAESLLAKKYGRKEGVLQGPSFLHANVGYCLTCWKSQGSEWDEGVVIMEKNLKPSDISGRRWMYTALTRFKKGVSLYWKD